MKKRKESESSERVSRLKENGLKTSIKEGSFSAFSSSMGETYMTPFALALNANTVHIGFLSAISGLISPISQFFGNGLMERFSRKKIIRSFVFFQVIIWVLIASLSYMLMAGVPQNILLITLIVFYSLFAMCAGFLHPSWFSWMGDLVPENSRGKYFSRRNRIVGFFALISAIFAAFLLDFFKTKGFVLLGFSILFVIASAARFISFLYFKKQYAPKFKLDKNYYFSIFDFLKRFDNYGKFSVFNALFNFALMTSSPFFAVYMLNELGFGYVTFMIVTMSSSFFYLIFTPFVGRFSDKYGNRKLFILSCFLFSLNPLLWIFIKSPVFLIFIPQVIIGLANAAMVLAVSNFTYDSTNSQHRALCLTYTNILAGLGIFFGSILGGLLLKNSFFGFGHSFILLFSLSAFLRFFVSLFFVPKIKEVRKVRKLPPMHITLVHPFRTLYAEIGWIKKVIK